MLDQSFSAENFLRVFSNENRKGTFNRELLSPAYLGIHSEVKTLFARKGLMDEQEFQNKLEILNAKKEQALKEFLTSLSEQCNEKSFKLQINQTTIKGKKAFSVNKSAASFFAVKQLQNNIFRTFKVKQANRFEIIKQLSCSLSDNFPKVLFRSDIKEFYESIPQNSIFKMIDENQLLNVQSKRLLRKLLFEYRNTKSSSDPDQGVGIPRGIGTSAYVSELYMRDFDKEVKSIPNVSYYARYVDDFVIIFIPNIGDDSNQYLSKVRAIATKFQLRLKDGSDGLENKTYTFDLVKDSSKIDFDFLGYKFALQEKKLQKLGISSRKIDRYDQRMKIAVEEYNINSKFSEKKARALLIKRFKFLTGNFHLINNKKRIKSGIYYSNVLVIENSKPSGEFRHLDNLLKKNIMGLQPYPSLTVNATKLKARIMNRYSFSSGFFHRFKRFHGFTDIELSEITIPWKKLGI